MARFVIRPVDGLPETVLTLKPGINRLGRSSNNDHSFPFAEISEYHCEVLVDKELIFVRDMNSSNGTYINGDRIQESALYAGQVMQIGKLEMVLDAQEIKISLPVIPKPEIPVENIIASVKLEDGFSSCLHHIERHGVWECPQCTRIFCDECIRKLRRVGGTELKLCSSCSNPCRYTPWAEMMRKKKKGFFSNVISKLTEGINRTTSRLKHPENPPR
jgi:hypothetical protein